MDERDYRAMNSLSKQDEISRSIIVPFLEWLVKKDIMISESADGNVFRSSQIGGRKYTYDELFDWYESETLI
jgi:hypothetical protein